MLLEGICYDKQPNNSEANFVSEVRYFTPEGAPLGTGPLPPKVDKRTVYRVFWKLDNSLHQLDEIKVEAILPNV